MRMMGTLRNLLWVLALVSLTQTAAAQSAQYGRDYVIVSPGMTLTRIMRERYPQNRRQWPSIIRQIIRSNPHAFVNGAPASLRVGMRLNLPDPATLGEPTRAQPAARQRQQQSTTQTQQQSATQTQQHRQSTRRAAQERSQTTRQSPSTSSASVAVPVPSTRFTTGSSAAIGTSSQRSQGAQQSTPVREPVTVLPPPIEDEEEEAQTTTVAQASAPSAASASSAAAAGDPELSSERPPWWWIVAAVLMAALVL